MTRIKTGTTRRKRHKKVLKQTKGHQGVRHRLYSRAKESLIHALKYSYAHRRKKKGDMRRLWTIRINAAVREHGLTYSKFIALLKKNEITMNNIGEKKIDSAKKTLLAYNKDLNLITFDATLSSDNAINIYIKPKLYILNTTKICVTISNWIKLRNI